MVGVITMCTLAGCIVCVLLFLHFFSMDVLKSILKFYHVHPILLLKLVFNNCFYNVTPQMPSMAHASS